MFAVGHKSVKFTSHLAELYGSFYTKQESWQ